MYVVLLIGGIASGKTAVSEYLKMQGADIIDTDVISRQLTLLGGTQYSEVVLHSLRDQFGSKIVNDQYILNRSALREIIFQDVSKKKALESILHPMIFQEVCARLQMKNNALYSVLVIPVIDKKSPYLGLADNILCIEVPHKLQIIRVVERDKITHELAKKMVLSQISNKERRMFADVIIINTDLNHTQRTLKTLHERYVRLSQKD